MWNELAEGSFINVVSLVSILFLEFGDENDCSLKSLFLKCVIFAVLK